MNRSKQNLEQRSTRCISKSWMKVIRHNVPAGSESHFKVVLVSDRFTGERFLNRHRMIYGTLTEELSNTVHALALHTYTIKEWEALQDTVFASPPCRGAGSIA
ncbi:possible regulator of murein genes [Klebsiella pneumoniae subsp. pneumoniae NTUH-K2044]|nr:possible regulator of murein genes [Klebsiella pneumoniae subsp. pneumoniae NTUH-K2044]